jgi:uncharacterized protein
VSAGQEFLGRGLSFPLRFSADGRAELVEGEDAVRRSLWLILSTALGERVMRPEFGCGLHDLVFAVADDETFGRIADAVQRAVVDWEPRVALDRVTVRPDPSDPYCLLIELEVQILAVNTSLNLVYPFYLGEAGDGA